MTEQLTYLSTRQQTSSSRAELLGRRPHHTSTPENPYSQSSSNHTRPLFASRDPSSLSHTTTPQYATREQHYNRESSFLSNTNTQLDEFLDRGRAVLGDLGNQKDVLKGTQKRLYSVGTTLGISGDTIRMVERRAKQDKWIFWGGVVVFFGFCWLVLHYLR